MVSITGGILLDSTVVNVGSWAIFTIPKPSRFGADLRVGYPRTAID